MFKNEDVTKQIEFHSQVFNSIQQAVIVTDIDAKIIRWNKFAEELYGYSFEEVVGKTTIEVIAPNGKMQEYSANVNALKTGENSKSEYILKTKSGREFVAKVNISPIRNSFGEIIAFVGFSYDITAQKEKEKEIFESEEKYRSLFETAEDAIFIAEAETGILVDVNKFAMQLIGYEKDEIIGKHFTFLHHENEITKYSNNFEIAKIAKGELFENLHFLHKNGSQIPIEGRSGGLFQVGGKLLHFSIFRDISERKQSEHKFQQQLNFSKALNKIAEIIITNENEEDIFENVNRIIGETLQLDRALIYNISYENNCIIALCEWLKIKHNDVAPTKGQYSSLEMFQNAFDEIRNTGSYIESHYNTINQNFIADGSYKILHEQLKIKSLIWYPFAFDKHGYFLFTMNHILEEHRWTAEDLQFLEAVAKQVSIALIKIQLLNERKQREAQLLKAKEIAEENEKKYRLIAENTSDGIFVSNAEGKITYASKSYCKQLGFSEEEELSRNTNDIYNIIHPEDRDKLFATIFKAIDEKKSDLIYTFRAKHKDGYYIWREDHAKFTYDNTGKLFQSDVICRDITERKNTELQINKLRQAIESSQACVVITDIDGNIEYANPYFSLRSGYEPEEYLGKNPKILKTELHPKSYYENLWSSIKSGKTWFGEFCNKNKFGETYWEKVVISPVMNTLNEITNFVAVKTDITELKKIADELILAKEKAEESDRLKSAFLKNISHEIRTPMNAICGFSDLLLKQNLSPQKQKQFTDFIHKSVNQLLTVIEDTITIAHIETNQLKINKIDINPNKLIYELFDEYKTSQIKAEKLQIDLNIHVIPDINVTLNNDFTHLKQIFNILLDNAFKFTEKGKIDFGYQLQENKINFYVTDTGIGIPKDKQETIFKSFAQSDEKIRQLFGGVGLGLSIAIGLIKLIGGKLEIYSEEKKGTKIEFSLFLNKTESIVNKTFSNEPKKLENIYLLVAEDEKLNFEYISELLSETKINIIHAENGLKAVEFCKNRNIDIILMDLKMPFMDGFEATSEIRKFNKTVPIIAQTALSNNEEDCLNSDFTAYISKPFSDSDLISLIKQHIHIK